MGKSGLYIARRLLRYSRLGFSFLRKKLNQLSLRFFYVCRSSSLLRNNLFTRSSRPISSSSLISKNNPSSYSYLIILSNSKFQHHAFNYPPPPQIPTNSFRKFSGAHNLGDNDYIKNEIRDIKGEIWEAQVDVGRSGSPLDAVKVLADKFDTFLEKLGLENLVDNEKEDWNNDDDYLFLISHYGKFPDHLKGFGEDIEYVQTYADMTVAYGEFVAAGGERCWFPFMSHYRRMLRGESNKEYDILEEGEDESDDEEYQKILTSLRQMKLRSRLMKRLIKAKSDS